MASKSGSNVWKWIAGGCGCLLLSVVGLGVLGWQLWPSIRAKATQSVEQNVAYQAALAHIESNPRVVAGLGTPIEAGLPQGFHVNIGSKGKTTTMTIPLTGPNGTGRLEFSATGSTREEIAFQNLVVWIGSEGIDLLAE